MRFSKRMLHFFVFSFFMLETLETEKRKNMKMEKAKKPYKNRFFKVVMQKCENSKKWIFSKTRLTLFVSGREKKRAFSCTLSVLAKFFFWPKTVQTRKNYKNSGFSGKLPKSKNDTFFWKKVFFGMGEKVGFTNCVFEKLCFLKTQFL